MTIIDRMDRLREARAATRRRHLSDLDPLLLAAALALSVMGVLLVWSASAAELSAAGQDTSSFAKRQAISVAMGVLLAYGVSRLPFTTFRVIAPWWYVAGVALVLLTLTPLGTTVAGARAWLALPGGFTIQPSEFTKVGLILLLAAIGSASVLAIGRRGTVIQSLLVAAVPIAIVLLQNDTGTVLVMAAFSFAIIVVGGASRRWVLGMLATAVTGAFVVIRLRLLQDYQLDRLTSFLNPQEDALAAAYNTLQARIAIAGGGIIGQGWFNGAQTQGGFVPVNESDFVFTVAAEEFGMLGALLIIALVAVVLWRGLIIAAEADSLFSRLVAVGIVAWLGFQAFENIGMNLGIMPVTGVTLPFVSFGGSSLMACWIAVGVLQVLHIRRRRGVLARPGDRPWRAGAGGPLAS